MKDKILTKRLMRKTSPTTHWLQKPLIMIVIALLGLVLVLTLMNMNIIKYENHLATGQTVLLELAPVDPRGFMQGDYMALSYALESNIFDAMQPGYAKFAQRVDAAASEAEIEAAEADNFEPNLRIYEPSDGYAIVKIDNNNVGHFVRLAKTNSRNHLEVNELPIYYRIRHGSVQLATNAFFFQEGHAESFEAAKYGLFRINDKGEPLLTEMVDGNFQMIKGKAESATESSS